MSAAQPEWLTGWLRDWYVNRKDGPLRCPVVGCRAIFRTEEEVKNRLNHTTKSSNDPALNDIERANVDFHHEVLRAICAVRECPMCPPGRYVRPRPSNMPPGQLDPDIRPLIEHEYAMHSSGGFSDPKKCIWFIRKFRAINFGGVPIWRGLYEYYIRNIQQQPEYLDFKTYLVEKLRMNEHDFLDKIFETDQNPYSGPVPQNERFRDYQKFYPVDPAAFLRSIQPPSIHNVRLTYVWITMMRKYDAAEF